METSSFSMDVVQAEGTRRLPIYLLLDCSSSMSGAPIAAVQQGVESCIQDIAADPYAKSTVHIAVITFDSSARMVTPGLVSIENFQPPQLTASGSTSLGQAFKELQKSLDSDLKAAITGQEKGDYKPLVFVLTDGQPTDDWQTPRQEILNRAKHKVVNVVTVGCGQGVDEQTLKAIAIGPAFKIDIDPDSFKDFFKWMSQSVQASVKVVSNPNAGAAPSMAPPAPPPSMQPIQWNF